ncbi:hypothetical protein GJ496_008300 [Pomphorhynchus laevis]|nr:hypothetical protein GJ496_008300 [Pomphorhynchus laevis]
MSPKIRAANKKAKASSDDPATWNCTINMHKRIHGVGFKRRAPQAIKEIKKFAKMIARTEDVRVDTDLNKYIWSKGVNHVPFRLRLRLEKRRNEDKESIHKMYTVAYHVPATALSLKEPTTKTLNK